MFKIMSVAALALVVTYSLVWAGPKVPKGGASPQQACSAILSELATLKDGEMLSPAFVKKYFKVEPSTNAIILPATDATWKAARTTAEADMKKVAAEVKNVDPELYVKLAERKQPPPNYAFKPTPNSLSGEGVTYVTAKDGRLYRVNLREQIARGPGGEMSHTSSVDIFEVSAQGELKQVGYSDGPHIAGSGADEHARWFHGHDKTTGDVVAQLATAGFEKSIVPDTLKWAQQFVEGLPK